MSTARLERADDLFEDDGETDPLQVNDRWKGVFQGDAPEVVFRVVSDPGEQAFEEDARPAAGRAA